MIESIMPFIVSTIDIYNLIITIFKVGWWCEGLGGDELSLLIFDDGG